MAFNHLVVATTSQCLVYRCSNWTTPHIFDLKDASGISVILQSPKYILLIDSQNGIQVRCLICGNTCLELLMLLSGV
jgi:intraflagellar transport protein 80